jgi:peptidoglycan hydrolase-like amidase
MQAQDREVTLVPEDHQHASIIVKDVRIGLGFHWERSEDQEFTGDIRLIRGPDGLLTLVNAVPLEDYLASVISSEMGARSHLELLKAHAVVSRSWLLAQLKPWKVPKDNGKAIKGRTESGSLIRWYDREDHFAFDVCADDHCQRYQGITKATTPAVRDAVGATFGNVLTFDEQLCDARYSKACGGMTEDFSTGWEDKTIPYLSARYDGDGWPQEYRLPLSDEANARLWITTEPPSYCNAMGGAILARILPGFDQETIRFYRWQSRLGQDELQSILSSKLGVEFGPISSLEPIERGASGRIVRLRITGERESLVMGKELEIRRALSLSHLLSSAFVVDEGERSNGVPAFFTLQGAGWGHGVGLCQIGAAVMAERGLDHRAILRHYFGQAEVESLYS